jgi:hypothetical protein
MYFKSDECPLEASSVMLYCAGQGRDHTECCYHNDVTTTLAGDKCLLLCNQASNIASFKLDLSFAACFDRFETIKRCFWNDIVYSLNQ